jgi:hypothetical protein
LDQPNHFGHQVQGVLMASQATFYWPRPLPMFNISNRQLEALLTSSGLTVIVTCNVKANKYTKRVGVRVQSMTEQPILISQRTRPINRLQNIPGQVNTDKNMPTGPLTTSPRLTAIGRLLMSSGKA